MAAQECPHHSQKLHRRLLAAVVGVAILILLVVLLAWAVLRPSKPRFVLQDATIYAFNFTAAVPAHLTTSIQLTLSARNPNGRIGVYYDRLRIYAAYRGQQITLPTHLPPTYQAHKEVALWSPFVYGNSVPVAPYHAAALSLDRNVGTAMINIRVNGRIRWRVGSFVSGRYHLNVDCPAYISFGGYIPNTVVVGSTIKYRLILNCHVNV
ncbi:PREDICTED: NDR1/HIN1-like protein 12 [Ipomoea nil]|uniref:NDR1/HIN1-like protein 12 n=1 Tax=Ipomoea nil TaxID=35883 RepID=UPI0009010C4B|nr:PREDICTED: NDR1/HIN1-like protein 12 [Ipomoea nil]